LTSNILNRLFQSSYLLIINAQSQYYNNDLRRHVNKIQKNVTIQIQSANNDPPLFDYPVYKVQILDNTPVGTNVLTIRYRSQQDLNPDLMHFDIEQQSNVQQVNFFGLKHSPSLKLLYINVKSSPIPSDKFDVSFVVRLTYSNLVVSSITAVNIKLLSSNSYFFTTYPSIVSPPIASVRIDLNSATLLTNTVIYSLQATNPTGSSSVIYEILNKDLNGKLFTIENNCVQIVYPIDVGFITPLPKNYLVSSKIFSKMTLSKKMKIKIYIYFQVVY
jgi:hypothetical protein